MVVDHKSRIPTAWDDPLMQAVCRLLDSRAVLEHQGLTKKLGPPQSETKALIDTFVKRLVRLESDKKAADLWRD